MLFNIPIESLEERYSAQWNRWFPKEFARLGIRYRVVNGKPLTNHIQHGSFLDVVSTNHYKACQLQCLCNLIHSGKITNNDVLFFHDLWFPGIEMLAYIRDGLDMKFKIGGILHAGTYDEHDFLYRKGMESWGKHIERGWFDFVDFIFVATKFHAELLVSKNRCSKSKIFVSGLPIYPEFVNKSTDKEDIVVFPHRLDPEKNPHLFDKIAFHLSRSFPSWSFLKTKEECMTKDEYYQLLNKSKIALSFSHQETWGIAMQEAVMCGCTPLVPARLSYQEMYPQVFKFESMNNCIAKLTSMMQAFNNNGTVASSLLQHTNELSSRFIYSGKHAIENMMNFINNYHVDIY